MKETKPKCSECQHLMSFHYYSCAWTKDWCSCAERWFSSAHAPKTHPRWCPLLKKGNKKEKAD